MEEIWKDIIGFEGLYKISNTGKILGIKRNALRSLSVDQDGYQVTGLYKNNKHYNVKVHRLVAEHFINNPCPEKYDRVNHIDGKKDNNLYTNLEWTDNSGNMKHAIKAGLYTPPTQLAHKARMIPTTLTYPDGTVLTFNSRKDACLHLGNTYPYGLDYKKYPYKRRDGIIVDIVK